VAVGADYNLLLISRIRDESPSGVRFGVIRTVSSTGGVITAAGLIFAASMFGLLFATISMMVQAGFVLGMGILLDTFLVRTVTVPAIAAMVGRANWWPSRFRPQRHAPARGAAPATATQGPESETPSTSEQLILELPSSVVHRQRKHAQRNYEHLAQQLPPQVGTNCLPDEHTTTTLENTHDGQVGEHEMPSCEGWNCLGPSPLECVSKARCARAARRQIVHSGTSNNHE